MCYEGRAFEDWEADLQAHSPDVRKKAVAALAHFGPRAAAALIKTYRSDPDEMVQGSALGALTEIEPQTRDTVRVILEAATTDPRSVFSTIATMIIVESEAFRRQAPGPLGQQEWQPPTQGGLRGSRRALLAPAPAGPGVLHQARTPTQQRHGAARAGPEAGPGRVLHAHAAASL